jgi:hypothetical protein
MKNIFNRISNKTKTALVLSALTVTAALGASQSAQAAPFDRNPGFEARGNGFRPGNRQTFTGTVVKERADNLFNMKSNGKTYNVYTVGRNPRRLDAGDRVRVTGKRVGDNDIRNARVEILRNR